jgi:hypothetical protein
MKARKIAENYERKKEELKRRKAGPRQKYEVRIKN